MVKREYDEFFHNVLKEEERGGHDAKEETRRVRRGSEDIKDGGMEGMSFISTERRLGRGVGRECDSDEPVGGVTLYGSAWLT